MRVGDAERQLPVDLAQRLGHAQLGEVMRLQPCVAPQAHVRAQGRLVEALGLRFEGTEHCEQREKKPQSQRTGSAAAAASVRTR